MNRLSMNSNVSPFTQMSFETTGKFLEAAIASSDYDPLDVSVYARRHSLFFFMR